MKNKVNRASDSLAGTVLAVLLVAALVLSQTPAGFAYASALGLADAPAHAQGAEAADAAEGGALGGEVEDAAAAPLAERSGEADDAARRSLDRVDSPDGSASAKEATSSSEERAPDAVEKPASTNAEGESREGGAGLAVVEGSASGEQAGPQGEGSEPSRAALGSAQGEGYVAPQGASSAELAAGTYTVSANVSMMTPMGIRGYATNPANPEGIGGQMGVPAAAVTNGSTLVVAADGTRTLTFTLINPVFTVQAAGSSPSASVVEATRVPIELKSDDSQYNDDLASAGITSRISTVTVELKDWSGTYTLQGCTEYATTLRKSFNIDLDLTVDLANAVRVVEGDFSKTFVDDEARVSVTVNVEEGSSAFESIQSAELSAQLVEDEGRRSAVKPALGRQYQKAPDFSLLDVRLISGGADIAVDDKVKFSVSLPGESGSEVFLHKGASLTALPAAQADGSLTFDSARLGSFVVTSAPGEANVRWLRSYTYADGASGTSATWVTNGYNEAVNNDALDMDKEEVLSNLYERLYLPFVGAVGARAHDGAAVDQALELVKESSGFSDPAIEGLYAMGLHVDMTSLGSNRVPLAAGFVSTIGNGNCGLSGTLPVSGKNVAIYLVEGTADKLTSATKVDAAIGGGTAFFDILPVDGNAVASLDGLDGRLLNGAYLLNGNKDWMSSENVAYYVAVAEAPAKIEKPVPAQGLVYNGQEQVGVAPGEGYRVSLTGSAVDAGSYTALVTLENGYAWADGSKGAATLAWTIEKAQLTAAYRSETVAANEAPRLSVDVSGFVNGETAASAKGFAAPTVSAPASLEAGATYDLTPVGGAAANYAFSYRSGVLTVAEAQAPALAPGTYTVTANLFVPSSENDILHLTAYMTNPKNPMEPEGSPNFGIPTDPVSGNAKLVVKEDGTKLLELALPNPAFTLIDFGAPTSGAQVLGIERDGKPYGANAQGRIVKAVVKLDGEEPVLTFPGSHVYAAPLRLDKTWGLSLAVDYASAVKLSDSTDLAVPGDNGGSAGGSSGGAGSAGESSGNAGGSANAGGSGGASGGSGNAASGGDVRRGTLAAGTYTVSANIWLSRQDTGLPLNPHLTSGDFPPMNPVARNAVLTVDAAGRAAVQVPIVIQSRIMTVNAISGLRIVDSSSNGGGLSSITVDLGVLEDAASVVSRSCTVDVTIGDMAMAIGGSIFGGERNHTYPATFQMNLSGVPASGGGSIPAAALAVMNGSASGDAAANAEKATAEALAAAEDKAARAKAKGVATKSNPAQAESDSASTGDPALVIGLGALATLAVAGAAAGTFAYRRKRVPSKAKARF